MTQQLSESIHEHCKQWETLSIFENVDEIKIQHYIRTYFCHSYLINRFIFPSLGLHVFTQIRKSPPIDESQGKTIKLILEVLEGELCNNNVFQRNNECHSHFKDYEEAYIAAGGNPAEIEQFHEMEKRLGFSSAIQKSPLWTHHLQEYAKLLQDALEDSTNAFWINLTLEEYLNKQFKVVLKNLPREKRYEKLRTFFARHVEFDEGEHGPAMQRFVEQYLKNSSQNSMGKTIAVIDAYAKTYDLQKV